MEKNIDRQLDIMDEAIMLVNMAKAETTEMTFEQALEIIKIDSIRQLEKAIYMCSPDNSLSDLNSSLDDILHTMNGLIPPEIESEKKQIFQLEREQKKQLYRKKQG